MNAIDTLFENILVFDLETTSLDFRVAEVIQMATVAFDDRSNEHHSYDKWAVTYDSFFSPSEPIPYEISAITSITNKMVEGSPSFAGELDEALNILTRKPLRIAHNSFYDTKVLEKYGITLDGVICTMRMAKKLYNDDPRVTAYNLPYLRYALDLPIDDSFVAHRADADAYMTAVLFEHLVRKAVEDWHLDMHKEASLGDQIIEWLDEPIIMHTMPFGKHKGQKMQDVPLSYWQWALENMDSLNEDKPEFDKDFSSSVVYAVEQIFENKG